MILVNDFDIDPVTKVHILNTYKFKEWIELQVKFEGHPLADDEKFGEELNPGFGTLFAVDGNSAYTAAHNVCKHDSDVLDEKLIADTRVIFNFRIDANGHLKTQYSEAEVFKIKKVSAHRFVKIDEKPEERTDWAWVKFDKPLNGIEPLELDFSPVQKGTKVYSIGHPSGLPAKLATSSTIKKVKKHYFTADLSMFGGNSGSLVCNRITKKVIGILFEGIAPDYHLVRNYEGLNQHRVKARQATKEDIAFVGYEKCQYINAIKVHLAQRITSIAQLGRNESINRSNQRSKMYLEMEKDEIKSLKLQNAISIAALFVPPFGTIYGVASKHFVAKDKAQLEDTMSNVKRIKSMLNNRVNNLEAYYIYICGKNPNSEDSIKFARALSAYYNSGEGVVIGFFDNQVQEVERYIDIENTFVGKFSPEMMLNLAKYEIKKGFKLSKNARELILIYMHNDFENPENSVAKARAKACYKITKHEPLYRNCLKKALKKISEYMVEQSRRLTFEEALEELGYKKPEPING